MLNKQHNNRLNKQQGFTIVELLIVIVVIAILAAISIVAYNGIQNRAKNNKTITAVASWAKAIQLYKVDNGTYPLIGHTCIGSVTTYDNDGRCWSTNGFVVQQPFIEMLKEYMGNQAPSPDTTKVFYSPEYFIRGARYDPNNNFIYYALVGKSDCPAVVGINQSYASVYSGGVQCGGKVE